MKRREQRKPNPFLEDSIMKKLIPFLGFSAFALTLSLATPTPSHALLCILSGTCGGEQSGGEAPEIDPSALGSAIALVIGGAAMLGDKFRRR
jgi:hypothetical protein